MQRLYSHPGETAEQGVMHECSYKLTHPVKLQSGPPLSNQEGAIEEKQGPTQRHVDRHGNIHFVASKDEK